MPENNITLNLIKDTKLQCYSIITTTDTKSYLNIVEKAYKDKGGIRGQRDPLKTSSAIRIRKRMIDDLKNGAVIPPIVIGIVIDEDKFQDIEKMNEADFSNFILQLEKNQISIIDGMQRTTALTEIEDLKSYKLRVEYWISTNINSLIYRMLVLNTGQVPWNIRRQVEVVFDSLIEELKTKITSTGFQIHKTDDKKRRVRSGVFQADQIIELYLVFGARKENINRQEKLADEFARLDFIEATSNYQFTDIFSDVLNILIQFDLVFEKFEGNNIDGRFQIGKDLFSSEPAQAGLIASFAIKIMGRPGSPEKSIEMQQEKLTEIKASAGILLQRLGAMNSQQMGEFLDFETLNSVIGGKTSGAVGDFERSVFLKAFETLINEEFRVDSMTVCWRSH